MPWASKQNSKISSQFWLFEFTLPWHCGQPLLSRPVSPFSTMESTSTVVGVKLTEDHRGPRWVENVNLVASEYPFPSEYLCSVQIVDFRHPSFYFNKYLLSSIVDKDKIRQILSELIAAFSLSIGILMLSCVEKIGPGFSFSSLFSHFAIRRFVVFFTCWGLRGRPPPAPQECWECQGTQGHARTSLHSLAERSWGQKRWGLVKDDRWFAQAAGGR